MDRISFQDYDRITDTLLYLSDTIVLNFTTVLSRKTKDGSKAFFHFETEYQSKFIGENISRSIKRMMNYYFVIDNKMDFANGFILRSQDIYIILKLIEDKLFPYYFDSSKRIFSIKDDRLFITGNFQPVIYPQSEYKVLSFEPAVIEYPDGFKEGVSIAINGQSVMVDIDKFLGFYYILKNTDMYSAACNMALYAKTEPYGTNIYQRKGLGGGGPLPDQNWSSINDDISNEMHNGNFLNNIKSTKG